MPRLPTLVRSFTRDQALLALKLVPFVCRTSARWALRLARACRSFLRFLRYDAQLLSQPAVIDSAIAAGITGDNTLTGTVPTDSAVVHTDSAPVSLINMFGCGIVVASQLGRRRT